MDGDTRLFDMIKRGHRSKQMINRKDWEEAFDLFDINCDGSLLLAELEKGIERRLLHKSWSQTLQKGGQEAVSAVIERIDDANPAVRRGSCEAMVTVASTGNAVAVEKILARLQDA